MHYIVTATELGGDESLRLWDLGERSRQFVSLPVDFEHQGEERDVKSVITEESDLVRVVDSMTRHFTGSDIRTYKLVAIASRKPGEMVTKEVSKKGILPQ
jgi:hypothetical protein